METRNLQSGAAASPPTHVLSPSVGYPSDGNPATGTPPGVPGAYWFHQQSEELRNLIIAAGLTPSDTDLTQVLQALNILYGTVYSSTVLVGSAVSLSSNVQTNITSLSLPAGTYDVSGMGAFHYSGSPAYSGLNVSASTVSATADANCVTRLNVASSPLTFDQCLPIPFSRFVLASPATIYLTAAITTTGTWSAYGILSARQVKK